MINRKIIISNKERREIDNQTERKDRRAQIGRGMNQQVRNTMKKMARETHIKLVT